MLFLNTFFLISSLCVIYSEAKSYNGYKLVRLFPTNEEDLKLFDTFESNDINFDIWNSNKDSYDVLLSPISFIKYKNILRYNNITIEVINDNIQKDIESQEQDRLIYNAKSEKSLLFQYARYQEIMDYVDKTVAANPSFAESYVAGQTVEGRDLKVIVLNPVKTSTRSLWIDCGIHAREWVSPATCVYTIETLINEFKNNDPKTVAIFNKYQIHIMPLVNPDGYEYSFNADRLWRKNRKLNSGSSCIGVDLNRNFGYKWMTGGSSNKPCSDVYAGASADSELETQAIQNALKKKQGNWDVYFNVHSYGNWWLLPFGFDYSFMQKPADYDDMMKQAKIGADAIKAVHGEVFTIGASSDLLYINSGGSSDWTKGVLNIKYSYVLELRPGRQSQDFYYGFIMPQSRMPLIATETYAGMKAFFYSLI